MTGRLSRLAVGALYMMVGLLVGGTLFMILKDCIRRGELSEYVPWIAIFWCIQSWLSLLPLQLSYGKGLYIGVPGPIFLSIALFIQALLLAAFANIVYIHRMYNENLKDKDFYEMLYGLLALLAAMLVQWSCAIYLLKRVES